MKQSKHGVWKRLNVVGYWGLTDQFDEQLNEWNWLPSDIHGLTPNEIIDRITPIVEYYEKMDEHELTGTNDVFYFSMLTLINMCLTLDELYENDIKHIFMYCDEFARNDEDTIIRHKFENDETNPMNIYGCFITSGKCVVSVSKDVSKTGVKIMDDNFY